MTRSSTLRRAFERQFVRLGRDFCGIALGSTMCAGLSHAAVDRPPQFVALAFDNCTELDRWNELEQFLRAAGNQIHFTFFISGTNFLSEQARDKYQGPRQAVGRANIDFGGSPDDVRTRVGYINRLRDAGNEIASHAVGHFYGGDTECKPGQRPGRDCGADWTLAEWMDEFGRYKSLFSNVTSNNGIEGSGFSFSGDQIVGFRAPQLSTNPAMYQALKSLGYSYDTSWPDGEDVDAWPTKNAQGLWLFKLARVEIAGLVMNERPVTNLSMDYNICVSQLRAQGGACETDLSDPEQIEKLGKQMMDTYLNYFRRNYMGNRAPLHIGHHFYGYQNGIYDKTLLKFAKAICSLPEVRCVTYRGLADFMVAQDAATLAAYQRGDFSRDGLREPAIDTDKQ